MSSINRTSRRALLTSAPLAAAAALVGGTVANGMAISMAEADGLDWPGSILRAEGVVDRLKKYYGGEWSTADEEAAAGMLKHCRDHGPEDDEAGLDATLAFFEHYNQSLDWVFRGDPVSLIADAAACSPRGAAEWATAMTTADADPAIIAANEYRAAAGAYQEALKSDDEGHGRRTTAAFNAHNKAMTALFNVTPVTFTGAVALLEAIASYDVGKDEPRGQSPLEWWASGQDDAAEAVNNTLLEIADVLRRTSEG
jgi:hypothetical protein